MTGAEFGILLCAAVGIGTIGVLLLWGIAWLLVKAGVLPR